MPAGIAIVLSQAFRPFFPLAALYAAVGVIVWLAGLSGMLPLPPDPTLWHAHEMLYGFAAAIIAGFMLTAVNNWTGLPACSPRSLAFAALLWIIARSGAFFPLADVHLITTFCDALFLPFIALLMSRVLLRSGNRRNFMFIPFLWSLAGVNIGFHISLYLDQVELARLLISLTVWLVGFLMVFMGGRVIPFFSARRCPL